MTPPAVGALTGLPVGEIDRWLREVHKVAALTGDSARDACDTLLWAIWERFKAGNPVPPDAQDASDTLDDAAWARWQVTEDISRLRETITRLRRQRGAGQIDAWEPATLARQASNVGHLAGPVARETMAADIAAVQREAAELAGELVVAVQRQALVAYGARVIVNASSIPGIVGGIAQAVAELRRLGALTAEDEAMAERGTRRAVRYRSDRKMEEAEVAAAGGNIKKAERLRAEAAVLYRQDAARAGLVEQEGQRPDRSGTDPNAAESES